ncbi:BadF/BadG/BcrA/BcrD ATPase family protein [Bacillus niameyensis]|uniref:BadF/BadG/BcrA/BcrD ATPase family protein n=1 Tax=Bacillus niameyensis TaxID=1522308 RepID=UPI0007815324|nr:BadF/BadG/BcrA/BcrD ATPase family protein [Bacillus niameyensis]
MVYTIGIDAGGTKTVGVVLNAEKDILFQAETGFGNPNVQLDQALAHIYQAISMCLASAYGKECKIIVMGVAGIETKENRARFESYFKQKIPLPIILVNDAVLAYHALLGNRDGILTIAGTGSISYGRKGDKDAYSGGWGHLLGDFGSAYDIAIRACRQITIEADQGVAHSHLSRTLMQEMGVNKAEEIKGFIYSATKGEIASLSYPIFVEAESGDEDAKSHFRIAGQDLAKQTFLLYQKLQLDQPLKIAYKGSLLEKNRFAQTAFQSALHEVIGEVQFVQNDITPAIGALTVASIYNDTPKKF